MAGGVRGVPVLIGACVVVLVVAGLGFSASGGNNRAGLLLLSVIIFLVTAVWFWQHNRFPALDARGATLLILALVVGLIGLLPVLYLGNAERIYVLKLGAIVFLSLLPGLLYPPVRGGEGPRLCAASTSWPCTACTSTATRTCRPHPKARCSIGRARSPPARARTTSICAGSIPTTAGHTRGRTASSSRRESATSYPS